MAKHNFDPSGLTNLLSQMQALSKALSANFQTEEFAATMGNIRQQIMESFEPMLQSQLHSTEVLRTLSIDLGNLVPPILQDVHNQLQNLVNPAFKDFLESFHELPRQTQAALITLGNHGWFFDLEMPLSFLWELENALNQGHIEEAEAALADYFREHLLSIENRLNPKFPHRAKAISMAFSAHKRGEYELSIPVFLAQTDGICYEVVNQYLFMRRNKKPGTAIYVDAVVSNTFRHALLSPLSQSLPISASENERGEHFNALNRHQVMHGESLGYGTEINSLKSISLLNYVSEVLRWDDENDS